MKRSCPSHWRKHLYVYCFTDFAITLPNRPLWKPSLFPFGLPLICCPWISASAMPVTHSIQCPCLQAADRTSQLIHFLEPFLTHGHPRNSSLSWRPFEWQPWVLIKTLLMASEKATQMNLSRKNRKNRFYQKELGIFHGIQRGEKQSENIKTRKQKHVKIKNKNFLSPSLFLWHHAPSHICLHASFILSTNWFSLFSGCAA